MSSADLSGLTDAYWQSTLDEQPLCDRREALHRSEQLHKDIQQQRQVNLQLQERIQQLEEEKQLASARCRIEIGLNRAAVDQLHVVIERCPQAIVALMTGKRSTNQQMNTSDVYAWALKDQMLVPSSDDDRDSDEEELERESKANLDRIEQLQAMLDRRDDEKKSVDGGLPDHVASSVSSNSE